MSVRSSSLIGILLLVTLMNFSATGVARTQIRGIVVDPQGAAIEKATVTVTDQKSGQVRITSTNAKGEFVFTELEPGTYRLSVSFAGFQSLMRENLQLAEGQSLDLEVQLAVAPTVERVDVHETPPTDPTYAQLRQIGFSGERATVQNVNVKRDAGHFHLQQGTLYFLSPVMDRVTGAVFVGQGRFTMRPPTEIERNHLRHFLTDTEDPTQVNEPFDELILYFTDNTYQELKNKVTIERGQVPSSVADTFKEHQQVLRHQLRQTVELRILADLYNPIRTSEAATGKGIFLAFIKGHKHKKLIFGLDPLGFGPEALSPEEVGLFSYDRDTFGLWSMFHYEHEYLNRTASSDEDHREYDITHHRIEAVIDRSEYLTASDQLTFIPRMPGLRVIRFDLFPRLRVSRVVSQTGAALPFIQADHEEGGAFAVIYPEPLAQQAHTLTIEYRGPEAVQDSGGGNFILNPAARANWYPNNWQASFGDRSSFDMTFRYPPNLQLIATGRKVREWQEEKSSASQWLGDLPLAVAGFNYGNFVIREAKDKNFEYAVYANRELPDQLKRIQLLVEDLQRDRRQQPGLGPGSGTLIDVPLESLSTAGLAKSALDEAMISIRIFTHYFGSNPYGRIVMSQQPDPSFAQSWPMLVYMTYLAYMDSTQRVMLGIPAHEFAEEVGPHEIAHQWWGHLVGWKTYHDQWLSEGFAEFSVSLYLEQAYHKEAKKRYERFLKFWEDQKKGIVEKIPLGTKGTSMRPNDVGPLWLGLRLNNGRTGGAYFPVTYRKGAFVLHMLRMLMMDPRASPDHRDDRFVAMMRDFVETYRHRSASTEDFQRMVEKHMTPEMDQDGNGRMDWFFNQWVYGTDLPHYRLEYSFSSSPEGKPLLRLSLTQSNVSPNFKMPLPIYLDFGQGRSLRLIARITGNNTVSNEIPLPEKPKAVKLCANYDVLCTVEEVKVK